MVVLAIFRWVHFYHFRHFWPFLGGSIFIFFGGHFGHFQDRRTADQPRMPVGVSKEVAAECGKRCRTEKGWSRDEQKAVLMTSKAPVRKWQ